MTEILDIVDEKGLPTGKTVDRQTAHEKGIRHRTAHVWILRRTSSGTEVLLQKRSRDKDLSLIHIYGTRIEDARRCQSRPYQRTEYGRTERRIA